MENKFPKYPILLVDDEVQSYKSYCFALETASINNVVYLNDSRKVLSLLEKQNVELIILDLLIPHLSGKELLSKIIQEFPHIPIIMLTAVDDVQIAVECMKSGAFDYMVKPVEKSRLINGVKKALDINALKRENLLLKNCLFSDALENPTAFSRILTQNKTMFSIFNYIETITKTGYPVLITGETGTGKELFARSIHSLSGRPGRFVPVNAAGLDDTIFSDTLFGHVKGAYTGADSDREGLIESASKGTLFLDEIGDVSPAVQTKLLRLIQENEYYSLGSDKPKKSDARIIAATNEDILNLIQQKRFRKDLFYRISTHQIAIPPLRERLEDIKILTDHFIAQSSAALGKKKPTPPVELYTLLGTYSFPGNIRELEGMILNAVSVHQKGVLSMDTFKPLIIGRGKTGEKGYNVETENEDLENSQVTTIMGKSTGQNFPSLKEVESLLIKEAMRRAKNNQTIASSLLGISRPTLIKRLKGMR